MFLMKDIIFFVKFGLKKLTIYTIILLSNLVPPPPSLVFINLMNGDYICLTNCFITRRPNPLVQEI